ncbi:response regulator [Deinococcus sp.]|uniref:response regulator n=1 Tax=Deinococcus sp. TaxID=47478 RepID=UPI003B5CD789
MMMDDLQATAAQPKTKLVLMVMFDTYQQFRLGKLLRETDVELADADSILQAQMVIAAQQPDLLLLAGELPNEQFAAFVSQLRQDERQTELPIIVMSESESPEAVTAALDAGADDFVARQIGDDELLARIRVRLDRPPTPHLPPRREARPHAGLLSEAAFTGPLGREVGRARQSRRPVWLAMLDLAELPRLTRTDSPPIVSLARQVQELVQADARLLDVTAIDTRGHLLLLWPELGGEAVKRRLQALVLRLTKEAFWLDGKRLYVKPLIGFARFTPDMSPEGFHAAAKLALRQAQLRRDLQPVEYLPPTAAARRALARASGAALALPAPGATPSRVLPPAGLSPVGPSRALPGGQSAAVRSAVVYSATWAAPAPPARPPRRWLRRLVWVGFLALLIALFTDWATHLGLSRTNSLYLLLAGLAALIVVVWAVMVWTAGNARYSAPPARLPPPRAPANSMRPEPER